MKKITSFQELKKTELSNQFIFLWILVLLVLLGSCKRTNKNQAEDSKIGEIIEYNNPPAEGFDIEGSNPIAILLADQVMNNMGGRASWDNTRFISWNFFGRRHLFWDKQESIVRIDLEEKVIVVDMDDMSGSVWENGTLIQDQDTVEKYLKKGKDIWINDSYWLFMPFKLKDSGVTLSYITEDSTQAGEPASIVRLTFNEVGNTPNNAYEIWVTDDPRLVKQWAWYKNEEDKEPVFILPWDDYKQYGDILLSGDRGEREITDIKVWEKPPKNVFTSPKPIKKSSS